MSQKRLEVIARLRDEMSGNLSVIKGNITRMGSVAEGVANRMTRSFSLVRAAVVALGAGFGAKAIISESASLERAQAQLTMLLGDQEQAAATLQRIRDFAARSPLETNQVIEGFVQLEAVGVRSADKVIEKLGDLSVMFTKDLRDVVSAFVSIEAEPLRKLGVEIDRTGDQAILKTKGMRLEVAKTSEAVRDGLLRIWEHRFPNAMEVATSTFSAKMAVFRSNIGDTAADIGAVFQPKLKEMLDQVNAWLEEHRAQIVALAQSAGEILSVTASFVSEKLDQTIFSPQFWGKLPVQVERAAGEMVHIFVTSLAVMTSHWDVWVPALMATLRTAFIGAMGGIILGVERLFLELERLLARIPGRIGEDAGIVAEQLARSIEAQESRLASGLSNEVAGIVDHVDAALALLDARLEAFRQRNGGQSLLDQGMSLIDGAAVESGLVDLDARIRAIVDKNLAAAEEVRKRLAGVSTPNGGKPGGGTGDETTGGSKKTELQKLNELYGVLGNRVKAIVDLRELELQKLIEQNSPLEQIMAAQDALTAATREQLTLERDKLQKSIEAAEKDTKNATLSAARVETFRTQLGLVDAKLADLGKTALSTLGVIDKIFAPKKEALDAMVALREAQLQQLIGSFRGAGAQDAAQQAIRDAERQRLSAEIDVTGSKVGILQGQPGRENEVAAMLADLNRMKVELQNIDQISANMKSPWDAMNAGMKQGLASLEMTNQKWMEFAEQSITSVANGLRTGIVDNIMAATKGMQSWGDAGKAVLTGLLDSLQKVALEFLALQAQQALMAAAKSAGNWVSGILGAIGGSIGSKATGGIVVGGLDSIPRAATGAIFRGTQLAVVADNPSRVEAAVPLPNGREIPVELKGGGEGVSLTFNVNALDVRGVRDLLLGEEKTIVNIILSALDSRPVVRRRFREA